MRTDHALSLSPIGRTGGFPCLLSGCLDAHLFAHYPAPPQPLTVLRSHGVSFTVAWPREETLLAFGQGTSWTRYGYGLCVTFIPARQTKKPSARCSASSAATSATLRRCPACFLIIPHQSSAIWAPNAS